MTSSTSSNSFTKTAQDQNAPLSFLLWKKQNLNYPEENVYYHYQLYLSRWFQINKQQNNATEKSFNLREKYLYLLQQLHTFFSEEEKQQWYNKIDIADDRELLTSIPFFAKKLKNIALYYQKLRKSLKHTKLKLNYVGTKNGIEKAVKNILLTGFTDLNEEIAPSLKSTLSTFENVKSNLNVFVEELYDDFSYFDKSPTVSPENYYDLTNSDNKSLFEANNIALSADGWIFNSLELLSYDDYTTYVNELTAGVTETTELDLYASLIQKYLGDTQLQTTLETLSSQLITIETSLNEGNNYFYYPYGNFDVSENLNKTFVPVSLSSLNIEGSTAGLNLQNADTLFIKAGNAIKGAWLKNVDYIESTSFLRAKLKENSTTTFIYPYPGYGLSAEEMEWTGVSLSATEEYTFLSKEYQSAINDAYWTSEIPLDTCESIFLNNTTLVDSKAFPNKNPNYADQVFVFPEKSASMVIPYGSASGAWLYHFDKTAIPISNDTDKTLTEQTILWPLTTISSITPFPSHLSAFDFNNLCESVNVSALNVPYAIASDTPENAEKIYKFDSHSITRTFDATECCWLSGSTTNTDTSSWVNQSGFSSRFISGEITPFVWDGPNNTPLSNVFQQITHRRDCSYITESGSHHDPNICTCKQVFYSPFGHNEETFNSGNTNADYIAYDPSIVGEESFVLENALTQSNKFAWFKTNDAPGWGNGEWVYGKDGKGSSFTLETGKRYVYHRARNKQQINYPTYIVNYKFPLQPNISTPKWIEAKKTIDGQWISTNKESNMVLNAGDMLKWDHPKTLTTKSLSSFYVLNEPSSTPNLWSSTNQLVMSTQYQNYAYINWPLSIIETDISDPQVPRDPDTNLPILFKDVVNVEWWEISHLETQTTQKLYNTTSFTFTPEMTGTYSVKVKATYKTETTYTSISAFQSPTTDPVFQIVPLLNFPNTNVTTKTIIFDDIPIIEVLPKYRIDHELLPFTRNTCSYLLEQPLFGWSYSTSTYDKKSRGARPFWASLFLDKTETTRYKGLFSWGYPTEFVDQYVPNFCPTVSDISLNYGTTLSYQTKNLGFLWNQPLKYKTYSGTTQWCTLSSSTNNPSSLSALYSINENNEPLLFATSEPSDIVLTNFINGYPVEVFYFAMNSFVWNISAEYYQQSSDTTSEDYLVNPYSFTVSSNRYYPTIATVPVAQQTFDVGVYGGYFLPYNLGALQYVNINFTPKLSGVYQNESFLTENINRFIAGRGLTNQDQFTRYTWEDDNEWLKEPPTSNKLSGSVKRDLQKYYQTFVPYKNTNSGFSVGLVNSQSRLSPWGGMEDSEWADKLSEPKSYTKVRNVQGWANYQYLKNTDLSMENWVSDIYGNQYGLYKKTTDEQNIFEKTKVPGQLWIRTSQQTVSPSFNALSGIYAFYDNSADKELYNQLTGNGIINIDCFEDTLMIETSGCALFVKILIDPQTEKITTSFDNIREISLAETNEYLAPVWYRSKDKQVFIPLLRINELDNIELDVYELIHDLMSNSLKFTSTNSDIFTSALDGYVFGSIESAATTFNEEKQELMITVSCLEKTSEKPIVCDFVLKLDSELSFKTATVYRSEEIQSPPFPTNETRLLTLSSSFVYVDLGIENAPFESKLINYSDELMITNTGILSGSLAAGTHFVNYELSNSFGTNRFGITLVY